MRRNGMDSVVKLQRGPLEIDIDGHLVFLDGREITLTALQFRILCLFVQKEGKMFSRLDILNLLHGESCEWYASCIDTQIYRLRLKLGKYRKWIETVHGAGYRFRILEKKRSTAESHSGDVVHLVSSAMCS